MSEMKTSDRAPRHAGGTLADWIGSAPEAWRGQLAGLPPVGSWREIAQSPAGHEARTRWASAGVLTILLANLCDEPELDDWTRSLALPSGSRVLDACCGPGVTTRLLAGQGHDAIGVDIDPETIAVAEQGPPTTARFEVGDLRDADLVRAIAPEVVLIGDWWDERLIDAVRLGAPRARVIVRLSNVVPPLRHGDDLAWNARWWSLLQQGYARAFGAGASSPLPGVAEAGLRHRFDRSIVRSGVLEPFQAARRHLDFVLWESKFLQEVATEGEWSRLRECWDPEGPAAWWRRSHAQCAHVLTTWST